MSLQQEHRPSPASGAPPCRSCRAPRRRPSRRSSSSPRAPGTRREGSALRGGDRSTHTHTRRSHQLVKLSSQARRRTTPRINSKKKISAEEGAAGVLTGSGLGPERVLGLLPAVVQDVRRRGCPRGGAGCRRPTPAPSWSCPSSPSPRRSGAPRPPRRRPWDSDQKPSFARLLTR